MLSSIHQLLSLETPPGMKAIQVLQLHLHLHLHLHRRPHLLLQVCYKHPELLRQAREACIAIREQEEVVGRQGKAQARAGPGREEQEELRLSLGGMAGEELLLGGLEDKLGKIAEVVEDKAAEEVTSIVYTDEGGREQSLVGKIVYQTDESGQSNIIIQEVQQQVEGKKLVRIDLGDMEGYMMAGQGEEEEEERRLEEELEGREARLEEEVDLKAAEQGEEMCKVEDVARSVVASLQGVIQTTGISSIPHLSLAPVAAHPRRRDAPTPQHG